MLKYTETTEKSWTKSTYIYIYQLSEFDIQFQLNKTY